MFPVSFCRNNVTLVPSCPQGRRPTATLTAVTAQEFVRDVLNPSYTCCEVCFPRTFSKWHAGQCTHICGHMLESGVCTSRCQAMHLPGVALAKPGEHYCSAHADDACQPPASKRPKVADAEQRTVEDVESNYEPGGTPLPRSPSAPRGSSPREVSPPPTLNRDESWEEWDADLVATLRRGTRPPSSPIVLESSQSAILVPASGEMSQSTQQHPLPPEPDWDELQRSVDRSRAGRSAGSATPPVLNSDGAEVVNLVSGTPPSSASVLPFEPAAGS